MAIRQRLILKTLFIPFRFATNVLTALAWTNCPSFKVRRATEGGPIVTQPFLCETFIYNFYYTSKFHTTFLSDLYKSPLSLFFLLLHSYFTRRFSCPN